ncbi:MAG: endolytic transglycosylase MltG [Patescibacteria group bacterium]|nr:endolytic transglycosylase MltG [Patescibacteria group bacterium]MDD4304577.1 endolytic transglycosylase MltG [Patescibacteria group bacterium]MDD4695612.1 endolytic transglycosylase MltG [Patescibacteria group bacterium]
MIKLSNINKIFIFFVLIFLLLCFFYLFQVKIPLSSDKEKIIFKIESGESSKIVSQKLEDSKIIRSAFWFRLYLKSKNLSSKIVSGSFELSSSMNFRGISDIITKNPKNFSEETIKTIEGWNSIQMAKYLEEKGFCIEKDFFDIIKKKFDYDFLSDKPNAFDLEGYLFPDTYRVYKSASCEDLVIKFLNNFENKLDDQIRQDIKSQNKTIFEIITMASIVEKEVRSVNDMKIVSGIFWDRIKNGQALESCATLAYILGENKDQYSYEDTQVDSAYNTYQNRGLPPGPIANPGLNAIKAAVYPEYTNYNYFLTDPETGNTIFSKTFEEHKQNKLKYLD